MNGAKTLMYSSDFPHWDFDPPESIPSRFGPLVRRQILAENALATYPKLAGLAGA
jgi:predicted TIM-barrel fold metal-dependent hydrolase